MKPYLSMSNGGAFVQNDALVVLEIFDDRTSCQRPDEDRAEYL